MLLSFMSTDSAPTTLLEHLAERTVSQHMLGTYFSMAATPSSGSSVSEPTLLNNAAVADANASSNVATASSPLNDAAAAAVDGGGVS